MQYEDRMPYLTLKNCLQAHQLNSLYTIFNSSLNNRHSKISSSDIWNL